MLRSSLQGASRLAPTWRSGPWPAPADGVHWGIGVAVGCLVVAQSAAFLWASAVIDVRYGADGLPPEAQRPLWILPVLGLGLWGVYLGGPVVVNRITGSGPMTDLDLRANPWQVAAAVAAGIGTQLAVLPALYHLILQFVSSDPGTTARELVDRVDTGLDVVLLVVAVVVIAPLAEELFYRGMLLPALSRRLGPVAGAVITSGVFAAMHGEAILLPGLFAFALVLSWLTITTGRVGVAVVAHMAFNATTVVKLLS